MSEMQLVTRNYDFVFYWNPKKWSMPSYEFLGNTSKILEWSIYFGPFEITKYKRTKNEN